MSQSVDIEYCHRAVSELERLEQNAYARNDLKRDFLNDIEHRRNFIAMSIGLILPALIWFYALNVASDYLHFRFEYSEAGSHVARHYGLLLSTTMLYAAVYLITRRLWFAEPFFRLRQRAVSSIIANYQHRRAAANQRARNILNCEELQGTRIPTQYLSISAIDQLLVLLHSGRAANLEEAVAMLTAELASNEHQRKQIPRITLVDRERRYLQNDGAAPLRLLVTAKR